jgi:hypothetical protein
MILSRYRHRSVTVFGPPLPTITDRYRFPSNVTYRYLNVTLPLLTVTHRYHTFTHHYRYDRFFRKFNIFFHHHFCIFLLQ